MGMAPTSDEPTSLRYCRDASVLARETLTGVLLLVPGVDEPMLVTSPGDVIWGLLNEPVNLVELTELLAEAYRAPVETVRADVEPLLAELVAAGAVIQQG